LIIGVLTAWSLWGQSLALVAQRASVEKQRTAIQRQLGGAKPVLIAEVALPPQRSPCAVIAEPEMARMIDAAASASRVSAKVIREVARQESAFRPCAVSVDGAEGLMQLMPATQASLGVDDPFDPEENLMAGARLLRELLLRYNGNIPLALSAYNAGPKRVDEANGIPRIAETQDYVARITARLRSGALGLTD
jgi:soluble lytic murein transglycosylase-like protein